MISLDDEIAAEYLAESREHLVDIEKDLLSIEQAGAAVDDEQVNRVFRAVHSIKGGAGFFDLLKIRELAHQTEEVLALIRSGKIAATPTRVSVLLRATDRLNELVQNPATSNEADISGIVAALDRLRTDDPPPIVDASRAAAPVIHEPRGPRPLRVLVVEDDFACRLLLQTFLSGYGECHIAVNGKEAVEAFGSAADRGQPYDLICMDIMMPEMDGRETVHRIRAHEEARGILSHYGAKIIMTTTLREMREIIRCFRELCDAYLMKPVDLGALLGKMKSLHLVE